jgi:hypothetical protein
MRTDLVITDRASLERRANEMRSRLMTNIATIEQRVREATSLRLQWSRHSRLVGLSFIGVAAALSYGAYQLEQRSVRRSSPTYRRRQRALAIRRIWRQPEALTRPGKPSIASELVRKLIVGSLSFLGMELMKRGIRRVLVAQAPSASQLDAARDERPVPRLLQP